MPEPPKIESKISVGVATIGGYATGLAAALTPLVVWLADQPLSDGLKATFVAAGAGLVAITNLGRYLQAYADIRSGGDPDPPETILPGGARSTLDHMIEEERRAVGGEQ